MEGIIYLCTNTKNNKKYIGKIVDVLIEKSDTDFLYGKTRTFKNVKISIPITPLFVIANEPSADGECGNLLRMQDLNLGQAKGSLRRSNDYIVTPRNDKKRQWLITPGQFTAIKITQASAWGLVGRILL